MNLWGSWFQGAGVSHGPWYTPLTMLRRSWVINLDAESDLARGSRETPSRVELARIQSYCEILRGTLIPDGDYLLWPLGDRPSVPPPSVPPRGTLGRSWCPTPWALEQLDRSGAVLPSAPARRVLWEVNHRAWAAALGLHLPRAEYCTSLPRLSSLFEEPWPSGGWLLKRPLGFAGRARLHLRGRTDLAEPRNQGWIARTVADGGALAEPMVTRALDLALHGFISQHGSLTRGRLTRQACDARGAWSSSEVAAPETLCGSDRGRLTRTFDETAEALWASGYHGPFNLDAYLWREDGGALRLQPRSEVNARYSMGWAVGMGSERPDLA